MTLLKIYNLETAEEVDVVCTLSEGEHVIGRGALLQCNDKRVSRKHAIINVSKDVVTIKAVHINPCFFKAVGGNNITILPKNTSVVLNDGDGFALLADIFWFRVRIISDNNTGDFVKNNVSEKLENKLECSINGETFTNNKDSSTFNSELTAADIPVVISSVPSTSKRCSDNESSVSIKRTKLSEENESSMDTSDKNVFCNENTSNQATSPVLDVLNISENAPQNDTLREENLATNIDSNKLINNLKNILEEDYGSRKEVKLEDATKSKEAAADDSKKVSDLNGTLNNDGVQIKQEVADENVRVKEEELSNSEVNNNKGETSNSVLLNPVKIKTEQSEDDSTLQSKNDCAGSNQNDPSCSTDGQNKNKTRRERCWFGPNCYRKNPIHRLDFSHPGDDDYDSDPDDDRPQCPFGAACYRKNLDHRRQFKHSNPPAPKPNGGDGYPKRKRKSPKKRPKTDDSSQDDPNDNDNGGNGTAGRKQRAAAKKIQTYNYDSSDDDYDYQDPFIDDASSDAFELSSDEDATDSDWEDSQEVDEESQETRRMLKEAKRFARGKGKKKNS